MATSTKRHEGRDKCHSHDCKENVFHVISGDNRNEPSVLAVCDSEIPEIKESVKNSKFF